MKETSRLNTDSIVQRNPKLIANQMDGEIVMMSVENGEYYGLDEIGSRIWELIESPVSVDQLINSLMTEFDVNHEECLNDTLEFLEDLRGKDLLLVINEPPA
ncbi:MAG TPA: lasso peptide biosynthesis PqqD family chaperone [Bacteroidales bacterium]|nr:lasso peptide biosynthesis PqqD family chaperone [Bacteroidales bacterium]